MAGDWLQGTRICGCPNQFGWEHSDSVGQFGRCEAPQLVQIGLAPTADKEADPSVAFRPGEVERSGGLNHSVSRQGDACSRQSFPHKGGGIGLLYSCGEGRAPLIVALYSDALA